MTGQELGTLAASDLKLIILVLDNGYLGMVRQLQQHFCDSRYSGVSMPGNPDFVKLAQAYGLKGYLVDDEESLGQALDLATDQSGSVLIQVALNPNSNIAPMFPLGGTMRGSL
jgi:acetolactate synthase-1/2/3 large subunit